MPRSDGLHDPGPLRLRRRTSIAYAYAFSIGAALFGLLAARGTPDAGSSRTVYALLAALCLLLTMVAVVDVCVMERRTRELRRRRPMP